MFMSIFKLILWRSVDDGPSLSVYLLAFFTHVLLQLMSMEARRLRYHFESFGICRFHSGSNTSRHLAASERAKFTGYILRRKRPYSVRLHVHLVDLAEAARTRKRASWAHPAYMTFLRDPVG